MREIYLNKEPALDQKQFISKANYLSKISIRRDLKAIRNLFIATILGFFIISGIYLILSKATYYTLYYGDRKNEEVVWYVIQNSFAPSNDTNNDYYYSVFQDYVQEIVDNLPGEILPDDYRIKIEVIDDYSINAFAAPGGRIILTKGLLDNIKSENGLMFVIGHEIGHLCRKDHIKEFARSFAASIISTIHFNGNLDIVDLLLLIENSDSRQAEIQADQWGLKTILAIYGHAGGATEFFGILKDNDIGTDAEYAMLSSHPATNDRVDAVEKIIKSNDIPILPLSRFD